MRRELGSDFGSALRRRAGRRAAAFVVVLAASLAPRGARAEEVDAGPPPTCDEEAFVACEAHEGGGACTVAGQPGTCANGACDRDGVYGEALQCITASQCGTKEQLDPCAGKAVDDACGTGGTCVALRCGNLGDGGTPLACIYETGGGGGGTSTPGTSQGTSGEVADAGDGCAVGRRGGVGAAGGGALAFAAVLAARTARARRRGARTNPA